ncbi:MAG: serine/threonine-protein kinase, partial [Planctomycetota bacterium]
MQVGPYELIAELGRGGMGVVHRARRPDLDRDFALKVVRPGTGLSPVQIARFQREARAAAALAGTPGIVTVHDIGVAEDGTLYLAMDLIAGRPLDEIVAHEPLPAANVARLGAQIARAVQAAHDRGVLHRDIKPANVLVDRNGAPHLADFGLAAAEQLDQQATKLTKSGEIFGTAAYMPPEQARGEAVDGTADVYSLGATLYEMAAGGPPFARDSTFATLMEVLHTPPPLAPLRRAGVPRDLQTIIAHCLAKSPGDRYPTPEALAADLDHFAAGEPILARPAGTAHHVWRAVRRRPLRTAGVAAVVCAAAAGGGAAWWFAGQRAADEGATKTVQQAERRADRTTRLVELWATLHRDGLHHLLVCEDAWHERAMPPETAAAALDATHTLCDRLAADDLLLPRAWAALATLYAGDEAAGRRELDALAADGTSGALTRIIIVRGYLALWSRGVVLPTVEIGATGIEVDGRMEYRDFVQFRERAAAILHTIHTDPIWERIQGSREFRDYLAAVALLVDKEFAEAGPAFRALQDSPEFAGEASLFGGLARFLSGEPEAAIVVVAPAVARGWPQAIELAATANLTVAARHYGDPAAAQVALDAAVKLGAVLAGTQPTEVRPRTMHALCLRQRGEFLRAIGRDAGPDYLEAKRLLDEAVAMAPPTPNLLRDRAQVSLLLAQHEAERGRDPRPAAREAIADARACVARRAKDRHAWLALGEAWGLIGQRLAALGEPSHDAFTNAIHAMDRSIEVRADAPARIRRAAVSRQQADAQAAAGADPLPALRAAARDLDTVLGEHPNLLEALAHRALTHWTTADW